MTYDEFICEFYSNELDELLQVHSNRLLRIKNIGYMESTQSLKDELFNIYEHEHEYFMEAAKGLFERLLDGIQRILNALFGKADDYNKSNRKDVKIVTNVKPEDLEKALNEADKAIKKPSLGAKIAAGATAIAGLVFGTKLIQKIRKRGGVKVSVKPDKKDAKSDTPSNDANNDSKDTSSESGEYEYDYETYKKYIESIRETAANRIETLRNKVKNDIILGNKEEKEEHVRYLKELIRHFTELIKMCNSMVPTFHNATNRKNDNDEMKRNIDAISNKIEDENTIHRKYGLADPHSEEDLKSMRTKSGMQKAIKDNSYVSNHEPLGYTNIKIDTPTFKQLIGRMMKNSEAITTFLHNLPDSFNDDVDNNYADKCMLYTHKAIKVFSELRDVCEKINYGISKLKDEDDMKSEIKSGCKSIYQCCNNIRKMEVKLGIPPVIYDTKMVSPVLTNKKAFQTLVDRLTVSNVRKSMQYYAKTN